MKYIHLILAFIILTLPIAGIVTLPVVNHHYIVYAGDTGATYPGTATTESVAPEDDRDWSDENNIKVDDGNYTYRSVYSAYSYRLKATNFGFTLPAGATVTGIKVEIERKEGDGDASAYDYRVQLLDAAGNLVGENKADTGTEWNTDWEIKTYGGASDTWGATPTETMVEDADFGVVLSNRSYVGATHWTYVDFIRMTVYYTGLTVDTTSATSINGTTATLNGDLTTGTATAEGFAWSTTSNSTTPTSGEVPPASYTVNSTSYGSYSSGVFDYDATGLLECTTYYYRAFAYLDGTGWVWGDEVEFDTLCPPEITTLPATYITNTSARLKALVNDDGGQACDVRFSYGTASGNCTVSTNCTTATCNSTSYTTTTAWVENTYTTGQEPYVDITNLVGGTTYYFCAQIRNDYQCSCGGEMSFTTESGVSTPSDFIGLPTANSISLKWTKGTGSTNTYIRAKTSEYPTSLADGTLVYADKLSSYLWTGLTSGQTYYFRAWGESGGAYSSSNVTLMVTTIAIAAGYEDQPTPNTPSTWYQAPDYTRMSKMPFYGIGNWWADSFQMDRSTWWFIFAMMFSVLMGILIYKVSGGKILIGIFTVVIGMGLSSFMGLMSMWLLLPALLLAIGAVVIGERM